MIYLKRLLQIRVVDIWTITGTSCSAKYTIAGYPWLSLVILGYQCLPCDYIFLSRRQKISEMPGKIIANAQTKSHILGSNLTKDDKG